VSAASSAPSVFRILPPVDRESLAALRAEVASAARAGEGRYVIDLDALSVLDSPVISALIATLRDVREVGSELILATSKPAILETLSVTALDKVFAVEPSQPDADREHAAVTDAPPVAPRRRGRSRLVTATVAMLALVGGLATASAAQGTQSPEAIVRQVVDANPSLRSYQARVHVNVHMTSFPFLAPHLEGSTYFKRPNNYEVVFDRVPGYAKGFDKLYADIGDPTNWERRFTMTVAGEKVVDGHTDVVLRLVQRVRGMIDHQDVAIDTSTYHIDEMEWHYYNGGVITMTQSFEREGSWDVLASQHAVIRIPYVHAVADARYDTYHTNVAINDAVFTKAEK
jgi:anti-anti-sigma factor